MTQVVEPRTGAKAAAPRIDRVHHWIGGQAVAGRSGRHGPIYDPATGQLAREVDFASAEEVDAAVRAARAAFAGWRGKALAR
jgi:malonate-semialdehyde dehydrogenase (acetylating) / methylmalonate-semialdehyde dehydrogenase